MREVVSVIGTECNIIPEPLERDSRSFLNRTSPGDVRLVLNDCIGRALLNGWIGHGDYGV